MLGERLKQVLEVKDISRYRIHKDLGISQGTLKNYIENATSPTPSILKQLCQYLNINETWLLTGEGEMHRSGQDAFRPMKAFKYLESKNILEKPYDLIEKAGLTLTEVNQMQEGTLPDPVGTALKIGSAFPEVEFIFNKGLAIEKKDSGSKTIPYYDIEVSAGPIAFYKDYPELPHTALEIPFVSDVDLAMPVYGDSMYPRIKSGDIVLLKKIKDPNVIMFGEVYLVITNDYRTIKYIRKHEDEDKVILVSENERFDPVVIRKESILHLFLYKGKFEKSQI